jgi:hypothetical protein
MASKILSGVLAGIPLSAVLVVYMLIRGKAFVQMLKSAGSDMNSMSDTTMFWLFLGTFVIMGLFFGGLAGIVYYFIGASKTFLWLALGLAILLSFLAAISHTPMVIDKVALNFTVALLLGILIPILA